MALSSAPIQSRSAEIRTHSKRVKRKKYRADQQHTGHCVIPTQVRAEVKGREHREDRYRDHFLNHLQLHGAKAAITHAVCGYLKTVLEKCDHPADHDHLPERLALKLQVTVPGNRHENVGANEKHNGPHASIRCHAGPRILLKSCLTQ